MNWQPGCLLCRRDGAARVRDALVVVANKIRASRGILMEGRDFTSKVHVVVTKRNARVEDFRLDGARVNVVTMQQFFDLVHCSVDIESRLGLQHNMYSAKKGAGIQAP
mmetsp:Transcript_34666/g.55948  ORF Transcript_34666/g.55948 Transcript_34666/m.55948 type:complete len:108 (-) Transcript_34666:766-1089(-)